MKQQIRQIRYNQHNGNNNSNWTVDDNSRKASMFGDYIAQGAKVTRLKSHIKNILVPRVSGTQGNIDVRNYIVQQLSELGYNVYVDEFKDKTPLGEVAFGNVIADSNPTACKQLVLACHYDSKKLDGFLGATDSAVPCAILLEIARTIKDYNLVNPSDSKLTHGVRFVFFDGEEAFVEWTNVDSLYGSRHLASKWSKQAMPKECGIGSELKRISLFVLLDLIGARDTKIPRYFDAKNYHKLATLERQYLTEFNESKRDLVFTGNFDRWNQGVQDDHVPFHIRQVPILLLLAGPFPSVWHTVNDNHECIDYAKTVRTLAVVDRFTIDYLHENK